MSRSSRRSPPGATEGRPHIADALVANGAVANRDEAFVRWLGNDSPVRRAPLRARPGGTRFGWSSRPAASRCMPTRSGAAAVRARGTR